MAINIKDLNLSEEDLIKTRYGYKIRPTETPRQEIMELKKTSYLEGIKKRIGGNIKKLKQFREENQKPIKIKTRNAIKKVGKKYKKISIKRLPPERFISEDRGFGSFLTPQTHKGNVNPLGNLNLLGSSPKRNIKRNINPFGNFRI